MENDGMKLRAFVLMLMSEEIWSFCTLCTSAVTLCGVTLTG